MSLCIGDIVRKGCYDTMLMKLGETAKIELTSVGIRIYRILDGILVMRLWANRLKPFVEIRLYNQGSQQDNMLKSIEIQFADPQVFIKVAALAEKALVRDGFSPT